MPLLYVRRLHPSGVLSRLLFIALTTLALLNGCGEKPKDLPPPAEVSVVEVTQKDVPIYIQFVGQTRGSHNVSIRARVEGWLDDIHFREGTEVNKGTLLYSIDPTPFVEKVAAAEGELAAAGAQVATARSQVAEAVAQVAEAEAELARAEGDVNKFAPLAAIAAVSQRDLDTAVAKRDAARQRVVAAKNHVDAARGGVDAARGQVEAAKAVLEASRIELGYTKIYAPASGLIGKTKAERGDLVGRSGTTILNEISAIDPIDVEFSISERDYLEFSKRFKREPDENADRATLDLLLADGSVHPHKGRGKFADRQIDPATGTLLIQAEFPNPEKVIRPGQFARVRVLVEVKKQAILVPQRAVQELQGHYQIYVVGSDNVAQIRPLSMGERVGKLWLVDQGLQPGEHVIVEGLQRVRPGVPVVPRAVVPAAESEQQTQAAGSGSSSASTTGP